MTRAERAAQREQRLKDQLLAAQHQRAKLEAQERAADRAARARRHQRVGALADAAGLFVWDDTTLAGLFHMLIQLQSAPNPIPVLEALLASQPGSAVCEVCCERLLVPKRLQHDASILREDNVPFGGGLARSDSVKPA